MEYGARPLKRLIRRELEDKLALGVMTGTVRSGGGRVLVDVEAGKAEQEETLAITTEGTQARVPSLPSHVVQSTEGEL